MNYILTLEVVVLQLFGDIIEFEPVICGSVKNSSVGENKNDFLMLIFLMFFLIDSIIIRCDNHTASAPDDAVHWGVYDGGLIGEDTLGSNKLEEGSKHEKEELHCYFIDNFIDIKHVKQSIECSLYDKSKLIIIIRIKSHRRDSSHSLNPSTSLRRITYNSLRTKI